MVVYVFGSSTVASTLQDALFGRLDLGRFRTHAVAVIREPYIDGGYPRPWAPEKFTPGYRSRTIWSLGLFRNARIALRAKPRNRALDHVACRQEPIMMSAVSRRRSSGDQVAWPKLHVGR